MKLPALGLLAILAVAAVLPPALAGAPPTGRTPRIGLLRSGTTEDGESALGAFTEGLHALGWVEAQNIVIERPSGVGDLAAAAAALSRMKVDVVLAVSTRSAQVARDSITTIPVVFVTFADPVRVGLVASLSRPGRNMTGITLMASALEAKRLELLRETVPNTRRVAVLWNPGNRDSVEQLRETQSAARALAMELTVHEATTPEALDTAFAAIARARVGAVFLLSDYMFFVERRRIAGLAERSRLPVIYHWRAYVDAGGLMSYGPNLADVFRRAAGYVDRILRGARPADLPVEQPERFELVVNLRTARALGLTIPPSLLVRADEVIR